MRSVSCAQNLRSSRARTSRGAGRRVSCRLPLRRVTRGVGAGHRGRLPAGSDVVVDPGHPLLLRGPDVLASYRGTLTAYFGFTQQSRRPLASLLPKVVLSRFALPAGTSFVLALDPPADLADEEASLFEELVVAADERLAQVPIGRMSTSAGAEATEPLRMFHHERFAEAWALSTRGRKPTRRTRGEPASFYGQRALRLTRAMARYTDYDNSTFAVFGALSADSVSSGGSVR
jgi:hypothetical protein